MGQLTQQMKHRDKDMVPLILVRAMFGLMAASLLLVAYAQWFDVPQAGVVRDVPIAQTTQIHFESTREGVSTVFDMDGNQVAFSGDDRMGFIGVMGIALRRERTVAAVQLDAPVNVIRRENGTIAITDPLTNWSAELIGYGQDNVAAFAGLLD